ncbi:MAG: hypothetical protein H5U38_06570 [Calditrichaeota bacterium]|nr:hypothetical protein [Calditrichota bacterium]
MPGRFHMAIACAVTACVPALGCTSAEAQQLFFPTGFARTPSTVSFRQDLNAYGWLYDLGYHYGRGRLLLGMRERFQASMLRVGLGEDKWKDDQNLEALAAYQLAPGLRLSLRATSSAFVDRQSGFRNDVRTDYLGGNVRVGITDRMWAEASLGSKWDQRFDRADWGLTYGTRLDIDRALLGGYVNTLQLELGGDQFPVRTNRDLALGYAVCREFAPGTSDSLRIALSNRRRDNYFSPAGDIETYEERPAGIYNHLTYRLSPNLHLSLQNAASYREVEVSLREESKVRDRRRRRDQEFEHWVGLDFARGAASWRTLVGYWAQDQRYDMPVTKAPSPFSPRAAFVTPENRSSRLTLVNEAGLGLAADSLAGRFSLSLLRYDTPDTNNFDDRDELRISGSFLLQHFFSSQLKLQLMASVNLYHMVYLFAERSADNNWNRVFRLTTRGFFAPTPELSFYQSFEVLANYVAYDFEQTFEETRSFVFRKFVADDSLNWQLSSRSRLYAESRLLLEENGRLYWEQWAERPLVSRTSLWVRLAWKYHLTRALELAPGFLYYRRQGWRHAVTSRQAWLEEEYERHFSRGPVLSVEYAAPSGLRLQARATRRRVHTTGQVPHTLNSVDLGLTWLF